MERRRMRVYLNYILSASLMLTPCSVLAINPPSDSSTTKALKRFTDQLPTNEDPKIEEALSIVEDIHQALMEESLTEYINSNPDIETAFDSVLIGNQESYLYNPLGEHTKTIKYDSDKHIRKLSEKILSINVKLDQGSLLFEGVVIKNDNEKSIKQHISVTQRIKNIKSENVLDRAYDEEILSILYKEKDGVKLILYDMAYSKELIGGSPIPSNSFYLDISEDLKKHTDSLKLQFVNKEEKEKFSENMEQYPIHNSQGDILLQAGDLLISYETENGSKAFAQLITRTKLYEHIKEIYENIVLLLEIRNSSNELDNILDLSKDKKDLPIHRSSQIVYNLINGIFNGNALDFLNQYKNHFSWLEERYFLYKAEQTKKNDMTPQSLYTSTGDSEKDSTNETITSKSNHTSTGDSAEEIIERIKKIKEFLKKNSKNLGNSTIALIGAVLVLWEFFNFTAFEDSPTMGSTYNMVLLGVGVLALVYSLPPLFMQILKRINKIMSLKQGKSSESFNKIQQSIQKTIQKWDGSNTATLLTGLGFKIVAILAPLFKRMFQVTGFSAAHYGLTHGLDRGLLNTITADSTLGKDLGLKKPLRLWMPSFVKNENTIEAMDTLIQRKKRVGHLARIMTYHAMAKSPSFNPSMAWMGALNLELQQLMENRGGKSKFLSDFYWIQKKLVKYIIESQKDNLQDVLQWDLESLEKMYSKAIELNEKSKKITTASKTISRFSDQSKFLLTRILDFNTSQENRLKNIKPNATISQQFTIGLIIDHILMVTIPLTPLTPRGGYNPGIGMDNYRLLNSSSPHLVEIALNIFAHLRMSAVNQIVDLSGKEQEILNRIMQYSEKDYKPQTSEEKVEIPILNYIFSSFRFPFQLGSKINRGTPVEERVDIGHFSWNIIKNWYRFIFIGLSMNFLFRELFTAQGMDTSLMGTLYYAAGAIIYFGIPQIWTQVHNQSIAKRLANNKENIKAIFSVIDRSTGNLYPEANRVKLINQDFKDAFIGFRSLYKHFRQFYSKKHINNLLIGFNEIEKHKLFEDYIETKSELKAEELLIQLEHLNIQEKEILLNHIGDAIKNNSKLFPNENNEIALTIHMLFTLGIFSNLAFVYLSANSFDPAKTNLTSILALASLTFAGFFSYYKLGAYSIADHIDRMRNFSLTDNQIVNKIQKTSDRIKRENIEQFLFIEDTIENQSIIKKLHENGIFTKQQLKKLSQEELMQIPGIGPKRAEKIQEALKIIHPASIRGVANKCMNAFKKIKLKKE